MIEDEASSTYFGGMFDLGLIGVSYSQANFQFFNEFRIGTPPDLSARDERTGIDYTNLKLGIAFGISYVRLGAYVLDQKGQGDLAYTYYDPTTGNQGSTIDSPITTRAKGYGAGLGFTTTRARAEVTYESLHDNELTINSDYPKEMTAPGDATRTSVVTELKLWKLMLGARYRIIKGNYRDLEDIISSSLLYQNLGDADERTEMTFNVSLGDSKGLSPSAFYTQSEVTSEELSPVFDNGLKYRAVTKSSAYGVSLSYRF